MPAPRLYIGSAEIADLMCISRREAQNLMQMFRMKGQTVTASKALRVSLKLFARFLAEQDGSSERETYEALKAALKTA